MSVVVDGAPLRLPELRNLDEQSRREIQTWMKAITQRVTQLRERTGGAGDAVAAAQSAAQSAAADTTAIASGADTATLDPANPLSYSPAGADAATINVLDHTRSGAGAPLVGAEVFDTVARDATHYVYYDDAGNAGGVQAYLTTTDNTVLSAAGRRYIGSIYIPPSSYGDRVFSSGI